MMWWLFASVFVTMVVPTVVQAGCFAERLCCVGRNLSCDAVEDSAWARANHDGIATAVGVDTSTAPALTATTATPAATVSLEKPEWVRFVSTISPIGQHDRRVGELRLSDERSSAYQKPIEIPIQWEEEEVEMEATTKRQEPQALEGAEMSILHPGGKSTTKGAAFTDLFADQTQPHGEDVHVEYYHNQPIVKYRIVNNDLPDEVRKFGLLRQKAGQRRCYCDAACTKTNDCCSDYRFICPARDCILSTWSDWSDCELTAEAPSSCSGVGVRSRRRSVVSEPTNAGSECGSIQEQVACYKPCFDYETALLLDYEYGVARIPGNPNRSKLYYDVPKLRFRLDKPTYCMTFTTYWLSAECRSKDVRAEMAVGTDVCVECQPTAQLDQGNRCAGEGWNDGHKGFWYMLKHRGCVGGWIRNAQHTPCTCRTEFSNMPRFIFV